jgi:hypothetical protein
MGASQYLGPAIVGGLNAPHYLDGRLLTARDLRDERTALLTRLANLGQASGDGVIQGFTVQGQGSIALQVAGGLALTPAGALLSFAGNVSLALVATGTAAGSGPSTADPGQFDCCDRTDVSGTTGLAPGAYVLTALPAQTLDGLSPTASLGGVSGGCEPRWDVDGLRFRAVSLDSFEPFAQGAPAPRRRNLLAHWCFGSVRLTDLPFDPFGFPERFDGLGGLADLTIDDVPLAVFDWDGKGLRSVDMWSARRHLVRPFALTAWGGLLSDRRVALAQARFLQFQEQLAVELADNSNLDARARFRFFPPAGFVPIRVTAAMVHPFILQAAIDLVGLVKASADKRVGPLLEDVLVKNADEVLKVAEGRAVAQSPITGAAPELLFARLPPWRLGRIDPDGVDYRLQHSWFDEAIDLDAEPEIDVLLPDDIFASVGAAALLDGVEQHAENVLAEFGSGTLLDQLGGAAGSRLLLAGEQLRLARASQVVSTQRYLQIYRSREFLRVGQHDTSGTSPRVLKKLREGLAASPQHFDVTALARLATAAARPYVMFVKRFQATEWISRDDRRRV